MCLHCCFRGDALHVSRSSELSQHRERDSSSPPLAGCLFAPLVDNYLFQINQIFIFSLSRSLFHMLPYQSTAKNPSLCRVAAERRPATQATSEHSSQMLVFFSLFVRAVQHRGVLFEPFIFSCSSSCPSAPWPGWSPDSWQHHRLLSWWGKVKTIGNLDQECVSQSQIRFLCGRVCIYIYTCVCVCPSTRAGSCVHPILRGYGGIAQQWGDLRLS